MSKSRPICISIAGFDPTGGAGVMADIKVFEKFKVRGFGILTANTIQTDSTYTKTIWANDSEMIHQLETLLKRYRVDFFKIGLINNTAGLQKVLDTIAMYSKAPTVIWDPVLKSTAKGDLNSDRLSWDINVPQDMNLICTPNQSEYDKLKEFDFPGSHLYIKGGDNEDSKGIDTLISSIEDKKSQFHPKIKTTKTKHGTGCMFSSALLANLSQGYPMNKAILRSKRFIERVIDSTDDLLGNINF